VRRRSIWWCWVRHWASAARLGVAVTDCVVVDDHARNARGARAAGAVVVHHGDEETTIAEVAALFDLRE
jgi:beta-phosphoglucomutase-like phosphatase (HAD superfamily)